MQMNKIKRKMTAVKVLSANKRIVLYWLFEVGGSYV